MKVNLLKFPMLAAALVVLGFGVSDAGAGGNDLLPSNTFLAAAQQSDGKLVAVGVTGDGTGHQRVLVVRYAADGSLDPTFGDGDGIVTFVFGAFPDEGDGASTVEVASDGRILVGGSAYALPPSASQTGAVARLLSDGTLDPAFGGDGTISIPDLTILNQLALQTDGRVVVAGWHLRSTGDPIFTVARLSADGSPDQSFGGSGIVTSDFGSGAPGFSEATTVLVQPDGRVLAGGRFYSSQAAGMAFARYLVDGTPDPSFGGGDGQVVTSPVAGSDASAADLELQADGKILAAGTASGPGRGSIVTTALLIRYAADGMVDTGFGDGDGQVAGDCLDADLVSTSADHLLSAGTGYNGGICVKRYSLDGSAVTTVADGLQPLGPNGGGRPLLFAGNDALIAGGSRFADMGASAGLARYLQDWSLDPRFGLGGVVFTPEFRRCHGQPISAASTGSGDTFGTQQDDVILGTPEPDRIFGFTGDDVMCGRGGDDRIGGGQGDDRLGGGDGDDRIQAGPGADLLLGAPVIWEQRHGSSVRRLRA